MLVSPSRDLVEHARKLSTQAREPVAHYEHRGRLQLPDEQHPRRARARAAESLPEQVATRRRIRDRYRELLDGGSGSFMPEAPWDGNAWLTASSSTWRRDRSRGEEAGARGTGLGAGPLEADAQRHLRCGHRMFGGDVARTLFEQGLCLPSGSSLTDADQDPGRRDAARRARLTAAPGAGG